MYNVGNRVVPISKSVLGPLEHSMVWVAAKDKGQPYLYITRIDSGYYVADSVEGSCTGDHFLTRDLIPYTEFLDTFYKDIGLPE
jgi:hypothetical protein